VIWTLSATTAVTRPLKISAIIQVAGETTISEEFVGVVAPHLHSRSLGVSRCHQNWRAQSF